MSSPTRPQRIAAGSSTPPTGTVSQLDVDALRSFARRINPTDAGAHNNLGVLYYNKGLIDEAVLAFLRALELDPTLEAARGNLDIAYVKSGRAEERVAELREAVAANPADSDAHWQLGRTLALLGEYHAAAGAFAELLQQNPGDVEALIQLGLAAKAGGGAEAAWDAFQSALDLDPNNASVHAWLGEIAWSRGAADQAFEWIDAALGIDPANRDALLLKSQVLTQLGQLDEAREASEAAEAAAPSGQRNLAINAASRSAPIGRDTPMAVTPQAELQHYNLGTAHRKQANYSDAITEFGLALDAGEDRDLVEQAMAEASLLLREPAQALALYEGLLKRAPNSPKLLNERGVAHHQAGRVNEARADYTAAVAADPQYALAHNNLGVALFHAGDAAGAMGAFQHALDVQPALGRARLNQALLHYKAKRFPEAFEAFRTVHESEPENAIAWNGVGLVLAEARKYQEARAAYARAIQSRPKYAEAHYNLSFALSNLGDFEGALRETKLAIDLEPYYVAQKLELAIDLQYEDPDLSIQPELGQEKRAVEVQDFAFDKGALDSLFKELGQGSGAATPVSTQAVPSGNVYALANDLISRGQFERAQVEVTRAMSRGADRIRGGTLLGDIFSKRGLWGEALERYREVRREASNDHAAMRGEAAALLKLGRAMEARHVAELLMPMLPGDVEALKLVATARGDAGDPRGGLAALELARRAGPARADVQSAIGDMAWKLRDTDAAIAAYRNALQLDPQFAVARYQLANVLMERGLWLDAERELLLALDAVPTYADATLSLSRLLRRVGRPDDALPLLIDLLQRDPYHFDGLITLGETLLELGRRDDAVVAFQRVLRFDPDHIGGLYYEGAILVEQERYREAIERFQRVVDMAPASEYARKARRDIKSATDLGRRFARTVG